MKEALIEILEEGELVLGSRTNGKYMVRFFEDDEEQGGTFVKTLEEAIEEEYKWEQEQREIMGTSTIDLSQEEIS